MTGLIVNKIYWMQKKKSFHKTYLRVFAAIFRIHLLSWPNALNVFSSRLNYPSTLLYTPVGSLVSSAWDESYSK
jgi:hypothetical protein